MDKVANKLLSKSNVMIMPVASQDLFVPLNKYDGGGMYIQTLYTSIYIKSQFVLMDAHSIESGRSVGGIHQRAKATP